MLDVVQHIKHAVCICVCAPDCVCVCFSPEQNEIGKFLFPITRPARLLKGRRKTYREEVLPNKTTLRIQLWRNEGGREGRKKERERERRMKRGNHKWKTKGGGENWKKGRTTERST